MIKLFSNHHFKKADNVRQNHMIITVNGMFTKRNKSPTKQAN